MKYFVSIGAQTHEVEVDGNRVTVDGVGLETDLGAVSGTHLYHLLLAGASWTVAAEPLEGAGRWTLGLVGERVEVAVQDERSRGIEAGSGKNKWSGGGGTVRAPRPGMVQTVHVAVGQAVEKGASLVTLASPEPSG